MLEADALVDYVPPWLLFVRGAVLLAQRFDPDEGVPRGSVRMVAQGLRFREVWASAGTSAAGDAVAYVAHIPSKIVASWYGPDGSSLGAAFEETDVIGLRIAPDGRRLLIARFDPPRGADDLWILDLARGTRTRLTSTPADDSVGVFTSDSREVIHGTDLAGPIALERLAADGLSEPSPVLAEPGTDWQASDVSPDGRTLAASRLTPRGYDIWVVPIGDPASRRSWLATEFNEERARFSPDGEEIAFQSNRAGRIEVYWRRVSGGPLVQVSTEGGSRPGFRRDGRALYFAGPGHRLHEAPLSRQGGELTAGRPRALATIETRGLVGYDVAPDGRLLVCRRVSGGIDSFRILVGWRARVEQEEGP